jgi:hypothetical protein
MNLSAPVCLEQAELAGALDSDAVERARELGLL